MQSSAVGHFSLLSEKFLTVFSREHKVDFGKLCIMYKLYSSAHMERMGLVISNTYCLTSYFVTEIRPPYWSIYVTNLSGFIEA